MSRKRNDSEQKKKVKINDVLDFAPVVKKQGATTYVAKGAPQVASGETKKGTHNRIVIIMPMGIPGMGKSTILETHIQPHFEKSGFGFSTFASDKIRKELVEELSAKYKKDGISKSKDSIF